MLASPYSQAWYLINTFFRRSRQTPRRCSKLPQVFCNAAPADKSIDPKGELFDFTVPGGMGGQETAARILKINPAAQLIVSSGYVEDPVLARHKKYGFTDVLSKPYTKFAFLDAVGRIIAQHSHPPTMTKEP